MSSPKEETKLEENGVNHKDPKKEKLKNSESSDKRKKEPNGEEKKPENNGSKTDESKRREKEEKKERENGEKREREKEREEKKEKEKEEKEKREREKGERKEREREEKREKEKEREERREREREEKREREREKEREKDKDDKTDKKKKDKRVGLMNFFPIRLFVPAAPEPERIEAGMNSPRRAKDMARNEERKKDEEERDKKNGGGTETAEGKSRRNSRVSKDRERSDKIEKTDKSDKSKTDRADDSTEDEPAPSFVTQVQRPNKAPTPAATLKVPKGKGDSDSGKPSPRRRSKAKNASSSEALLPPQRPEHKGRKTLVLDLDETLVHSSFKEVDRYDFKLTIEIEKRKHTLYVAKRPYVDEFLKHMSELYELVVFTASLAVYANAVMDRLDPNGYVPYRLFRDSCTNYKGTYIKDMGRMGRDLKKIMILDNSSHSYAFNPSLGVPCESWFDDYADFELLTLSKVFEDLASNEIEDLAPELEKIFGEPEDVLAEIDAAVDDS